MTTDYDQEFQQYEHKIFGKPISVLTSSQLKAAIAQRGGVIKTSFYYKDDLINRLKELLKEEMMNNNANTAAGILSSNLGSSSTNLNSSSVGIGVGNRELNSSGVGIGIGNMNGSSTGIMTPSSTLSPNNLTLSEKKRVLQNQQQQQQISNNDYDDTSSMTDQIYNESSSPITSTPSKKLNTGFGYYSSNKANITTASSGVSSNSNTPTISMQNLYEDNHKQRALELEHKILGNFSFYFILKRLNYSPALKLTEEFVKFIVLKVMDNDNGVDGLSTKLLAPPLINKVWCEVILNTIKYKELLNLIKCEVHHNPILGMNDSLEAKRKRYERCVELYNFYFNSNPTETNPEIWPANLYLDSDVSSFSFDDDDSIQVINDNPSSQTLTPQQILKLQQKNEYLQNKLKSSSEKISHLEKEIFRNNSNSSNNNSKINNISKNHSSNSSENGFDSSNEDQHHEDIEIVSNINGGPKKGLNQHQQQSDSDGESNLEMDLDNNNDNDNDNNDNNNNNNNSSNNNSNSNSNKDSSSNGNGIDSNGIIANGNGHHHYNGSGEHHDEEINQQDQHEQEEEDGDEISIQVSGNKGNLSYSIKKNSPIKKIMDSSAKKFGYDSNSIRFLFRNKALSPDSTPISIGLENNDIIDLIATTTDN